MGIFGKFSSLWSGGPSAPDVKPYDSDPYMGYADGKWGGEGGKRLMGADRMSYDALQKIMARNPGFSEEEINSFLQPGLQQTKHEERSGLRRLNQDKAASGGYGGGARTRGRGEILSKAGAQRSNMVWDTRAMAAKVALQDRYRQLQAAESYVGPRLQYAQNEASQRTGYNQHLNSLAFQQYQSDLGQYNQDFDWAWDQGQSAASMGMMG